MNGRLAKQLRREARRVAEPHIRSQFAEEALRELKRWLNGLPLKDRLRAAWRILGRRL